MTVQEYVQQLLEYMSVDATNVGVEETEEYVFVTLEIPEEDAGKMIGKHGETITSLSHLVTVSFREQLENKKVIVDVNGYKERREDEAIEMGREYADRAIETGRPQHLPRVLQAHQRRVIHQDLQEYAGIFTQSEGEGRNRHLVVYPESMKDQVMADDELGVELSPNLGVLTDDEPVVGNTYQEDSNE